MSDQQEAADQGMVEAAREALKVSAEAQATSRPR
jgi:hypothetical protein